MGIEGLLTLLILAGAVILFVTERLPVDVVAMIVLASLLMLGLVSPAQALSGFSSEATITVAAMFVLSTGLTRTGALRAVGAAFSRIRQTWLFTLTVMITLGGMSAFVNNTAALAVFMPIVLGVAAAKRFSASKVLIPMSYAAQMGGVCTLIGTSTNLLVNSLAMDMGLPGFGLFEFAPLGLITMAAGLVYVTLVGPWLLPDRRTPELTENYDLGKYIAELRVMPDSPLIGQSVAEAKLGENHSVFVLEILRGEEKIWSPRAQKLQAGDVLLARGDWSRLSALKDSSKLELEPEFKLRDEQFRDDNQVLTEVMVTPGSRFIGQTLRSLEFSWHYNATVLAIHRRGEVLREKLRDVELAVGDILLMITSPSEMHHLRSNQNVVVLTEREGVPTSTRKAWIALAIMVSVIGAVTLDWLPIVASSILGCIGLVLFRCLEPEEVYEAVDWRVIMLLAGVLPLGIALQSSGAAAFLADRALDIVGGWGPLAVLAAIYLLTATLTEFMSNNASAVLLTPVAVAAAQSIDANPAPFLVAVAFAASTSFATPVGYQTNTMVYSAGGYRFMDFVKIGVPLNLLFWAIAVAFIPIFWPL
jgi:di/tricarboxylate transporter